MVVKYCKMGNFQIHIFMKANTSQAFRKDIYENGKALLCFAIYLTTLQKFIFKKWFRIFEIFVNKAIHK